MAGTACALPVCRDSGTGSHADRKDIIKISQRELRRLHVIREGNRWVTKAERGRSELLSLSDRQIRRLIKKVVKEGDSGIIHKSRGKLSNKSLPKKIKDKAIELNWQKYIGFGMPQNQKKGDDQVKYKKRTFLNW